MQNTTLLHSLLSTLYLKRDTDHMNPGAAMLRHYALSDANLPTYRAGQTYRAEVNPHQPSRFKWSSVRPLISAINPSGCGNSPRQSR